MKALTLLFLLALSTSSFGQGISGCETVSLKGNEAIKAAEPCVLQLASYALTQPMIGSTEEAHHARKVVMGWLEATPDYTFSLNSEIMKVFKGDNLLLFNLYACCLAKGALSKEADFHKAAVGFLVEYVKDPAHLVDQSKPVKKLIKNWDAGMVEGYYE